MSTLEETWAWMYPSVQDLKSDIAENPDKSWEERRAFFVERLGLSDPADHPLTEALIQWLDELPDDDRATLLAGDELDTIAYELAQSHSGEAGQDAQEEPGFDHDAWSSFLSEYASQWDGTAESWEQFTEWLRYYANANGFGAPTDSLISSLDGQPPADRVTVLAQYGVVFAAPTQQLAEPASVEEFAGEHMAGLLTENPAFAEIPEERRRELIAQALGEMAKSAQ